MLALFDPRGALGQAPVRDVVFFLKSNAVGRDLPWPRPTELIVLDPGPYRGSGADPLTSSAYRALYDSLRDASGQVIPNLLRRHGVEPGGRVAFVGFSAAHGFLSPLLANAADRAHIDSVLLMDACFGSGKSGYVAALRDAAAGRMMLVSATDGTPGSRDALASGTACFEQSVIAPSGLTPQRGRVRPPAPEPSGGAWQFGAGGHWLNYSGDVAHYNFGQLTRPVMEAYLLPRFQGALGGAGAPAAARGGGGLVLALGVAALGIVGALWLTRGRFAPNPATQRSGASDRDVDDALEAAELDGCISPKITAREERVLTIDELEAYDDLGSWPEWSRGEFNSMSGEEVKQELNRFRGSSFARRAERWLHDDSFPSIVIVQTPERTFVGDGRGRASVAIAAERRIPATILTVRCQAAYPFT